MSGPPWSGSDIAPQLRIVFMGTPALAAHALERLVTSGEPHFHVVGVVTQPDEPRGRGQRVTESEVAEVAARHDLATLKPKKIRTPEFLTEMKALEPDLLIVVAYGRILPQSILDVPRLMPINVHASLLPRHRGAAPVEGAILSGDSGTGVTIMRITEKMDAGPMLLKQTIPIAPRDTQESLKDKLAELGAEALLDALRQIARGEAKETPQDESQATYTSPIKKTDAIIDWSSNAKQIERMTRAYDPWPVARTTLRGSELLVYRAATESATARGATPGQIVAIKRHVIVECGEGRLRLVEVQAPGRQRMPAADFVRGARIREGDRLGT